jgi:tRNA wybutosine-synthesizing protein 2
MQARLIPLSDLPGIASEPWVDQTRKPYVSREGAYVPVRDGHHATHSLPERQRCGRGYQKLGDVIAFHGRRPSHPELDEVQEREHPRGIIWIEGHEGVMRTPKITLLSGSAGEVAFRETGIEYRLDVEKIMFSQGNRGEKVRISRLVTAGERAGDMFAGIGYFSLGLARAGAQVHAMEINPVSCRYLEENCSINCLTERVQVSCGDCRHLLTGVYDRIHMGHYDAVYFLPDALGHTHPGTWIHVHMLGDRSREILDMVHSRGLDAELDVHRVKKAGPRLWHQVADVVIA